MVAEGAAYDVLLGLHVTSALVALGSVAATGAYASMAARTGEAHKADERRAQAQRRFFGPGPNWPARAIFLVPVFGLALAATDGGFRRFGQVWLATSVALWLLAAGVAVASLWPAESRIQRLLPDLVPHNCVDTLSQPEPPGEDPRALATTNRADLARAARRASISAAVIDVAFVAAFVLMVARPGA